MLWLAVGTHVTEYGQLLDSRLPRQNLDLCLLETSVLCARAGKEVGVDAITTRPSSKTGMPLHTEHHKLCSGDAVGCPTPAVAVLYGDTLHDGD